MTAAEAIAHLEGRLLVQGDGWTDPVGQVVACDLMSDVLVVDRDRVLLVTSLATEQAVRTAHVIGGVGVIVVNAKSVTDATVALAVALGVTLATSDRTKFEACVALGELEICA